MFKFSGCFNQTKFNPWPGHFSFVSFLSIWKALPPTNHDQWRIQRVFKSFLQTFPMTKNYFIFMQNFCKSMKINKLPGKIKKIKPPHEPPIKKSWIGLKRQLQNLVWSLFFCCPIVKFGEFIQFGVHSAPIDLPKRP